MLALLSVPLLGQKLRPASMLAFAFGFVGVLIISTGGDVLGFRFTDPLGASLAVGSSVVWAGARAGSPAARAGRSDHGSASSATLLSDPTALTRPHEQPPIPSNQSGPRCLVSTFSFPVFILFTLNSIC